MYQIPDQTGRRFLITGASSGLGRETAWRLAKAGADVIMVDRDLAKGEAVKEEILTSCPQAKVEMCFLDLADLKNVADFAQKLMSSKKGLDVLINNAGVMSPPKRFVTKDKFELQLGTNFLGHFALTNYLVPFLLKTGKAPRVTMMSSSAAIIGFLLGMKDLQSEKLYIPFLAYARSKLACLMMSNELAEIAKKSNWNLVSNAAHPGCTRTNIMITGPNMGTGKRKMPWPFYFIPHMYPDKGAVPLLQAATDPSALPKSYYGPRWLLIGKSTRVKQPESARWCDSQKLWQEAERLTGVCLPKTI